MSPPDSMPSRLVAAAAGLALALTACAPSTTGPVTPSVTSAPVSAPSTQTGAAPTTASTPPPSMTLPAGTPTAPAPSGSATVPTVASASVVPPNPASVAAPSATVPVRMDLRQGSKGADVVALQNRLNELGFWVGPADGDFGMQTRQGVIAAQKAAGIPTDGWVGPITKAALDKGITLKPRSTSGHVLEVDKARQLLLVVDDGRVTRYYNTSTGGEYTYWNPGSGKYESAATPAGSFTVFRQVAGWDPGYLGAIYAPMYFNGGIAVHGTNRDVADTPESHGCVRLAIPMMDEIRRSGQIAVGTKVLVY